MKKMRDEEVQINDGGIGKHRLPPRITTAKITTKLQNYSHPESSEN